MAEPQTRAGPADIERLLRQGFARQSAGDAASAEAIYAQVLELRPNEHRALTLSAALAQASGDEAAAAERYAAALAARPNAPAPRLELARLRFRQGDARTALDLIRPFTTAMPGDVKGWRLRGQAADALGESAEAIACYERALAAGDQRVAPLLGQALSRSGEKARAAAVYAAAIAREPENAKLHGVLADALAATDRAHEAIESYRRAVTLDPGLYEAHGGLGVALQSLGRYEDAANAYLAALEGAPDRWEVLHNLAGCRLDQGRPRLAQAIYDDVIRRNPTYQPSRRNRCLAVAYDEDTSPADLAAACRAAVADITVGPRPPARPLGDRAVRVGLVSADFRSHSVSAFVEPLLDYADPAAIVIHAYASIARPDHVTARIADKAAHWRDMTGADAATLAAAVRADRIDILIDLAGHTGDAQLDVFGLRPAAVQASWLGWPATTGFAAIDFKLSDALLTPAGGAEPFAETPWNLNGPALCFRPPDDAGPVAPPPMLKNGYPTFGSFNRIAKASPRTIGLWAEIMAARPDARLLLKDKAFLCPAATERILRRLANAGIATERVTVHGQTPRKADHFALYGAMDVALDCMPYNGVTTTSEALWMGVPTVALAGQSSLSRYALAVLSHAGFPEWVADAPADYVACALALADDPPALARIRRDMRGRLAASPLMDGRRFARSFEAACRGMFARFAT